MIAVIDSNVLVRVLNPSDVLHEDVRVALSILNGRGFDFRITFQIVAEFWSVCTRPTTSRDGLGLTIERVDERLSRLLKRWPVLDEKSEAFPAWRELVESTRSLGRQVHDARIAAAMKSHGIERLVSFNESDFARYPFVTVLNPTKVANEIVP